MRISSAQTDANSETKSSAGDKHETGKAMMQLEVEQASRQLAEIENLWFSFQKITTDTAHTQAGLGSLVLTNKGYFYIATAIGKLNCVDIVCYAISIHSPLAQMMIGKAKGARFSFNELDYQIIDLV